MSGYERLAEFLADQKRDHWEASFAEIERVIGRPLPASASKYPAWWANQKNSGTARPGAGAASVGARPRWTLRVAA